MLLQIFIFIFWLPNNCLNFLQAPEILPRPYCIVYYLTGDFQCEIFQIVELDI